MSTAALRFIQIVFSNPFSTIRRRIIPSTYLSLHYHIIFSTKNRKPWITDLWKDDLHAYLGGTVIGLNGVPEAIGGIDDHVHLLVGLRATHTFADFVRELKKAGTIWAHNLKHESKFAWQEGYAAFTVSPTARPGVKSYIANQQEHHRRRDYLGELKWLLQEAGIVYDPKYLE